MSNNMNAVCIGCRLRRKKCDRGKPICTSCLELNISPDLCIYPKSKLQLASKDSKITLDLLRSKNKELKEEYEAVKAGKKPSTNSLQNNNVVLSSQKNPSDKIDNTPINPSSQDLEFVQDPINTTVKETNEYLLHCGPLSWVSLMSFEKDFAQLCLQFGQIIAIAKDLRKDSRRGEFIDQADSDTRFNDIKGRLSRILLGIDPNEYIFKVMEELFLEIENRLPHYDMVMTLIDRFFITTRIQKMGVIQLNEDSFYETLSQIITKDSNGRVKITVKFPDEYYKTPGVSLLLSIVATMLFQVNQLVNPITSANHLLILDCIKVLFVGFSIFKRTSPTPEAVVSPELAVQLLQGFLYYVGFDRYNPHGREHEKSDKTGENAICVRKMVSYARALKLNCDIEKIYKHKSKNYRRSLKSIWFALAFLDIGESIEFGLPTKIKRDELYCYDDCQDEYSKSVIVLNELIADFQNIEKISNTLDFIQLVEKNLITKAKNTLRDLFKPIHEDLKTLNEMNFDDLSLVHKFMAITQTFNVRLTLLTLIETYYHHCFVRLKQSGYDNTDFCKKYQILAMKYSLLVFQVISGIFSAYRRLWGHENSTTFGSLGTILAIFSTMKFTFRRVTIFTGARVFEGLPVEKSTVILDLFELGKETDSEILNYLLRTQKHPFFTIADLENGVVDDHDEILLKRFSILTDYRFSMLSAAVSMYNLAESLNNSRYDLNFVRLNRAFYFALKLVSFFTRLEYRNEVYGKDSLTSGKNKKNTINEVNLEEFYRQAISTKSNDALDLEIFFSAPNSSGFF